MLKLEIVTPEKKVFDDTVDFVTIPTASGEAGIYPNHAPLISALKPGVLAYSNRGTSGRLAISGGFVEVSRNSVSVLTDTAETADEIDVEAARLEREEAQKTLTANWTAPLEETESLREDVERAETRIRLASGKV